MFKKRIIITVFSCFCISFLAFSGSDWPQFRGLNRDGISPETGLIHEWSTTGPEELWRKPLGEGFSAISIANGKLYTMYATEIEGKATEVASCFDPQTGAELWRVPLCDRYNTEFGDGPRSTPVIHDGNVYVLSSKGDLAALSAKDGSIKWRKSLLEQFGSKVPNWGFSTTGVIDGDLLLIQTGGPEGKSFAGIELKDGTTRWSLDSSRVLYNSTMPAEIFGKKCYISVAAERIICLDREGKELWDHPWPKGETHAMPLFIAPNKLYVSGAQGIGAKFYEIEKTDSKPKLKEIWNSPRLRNHFSTSVYHEGYLYGFDNATLTCVSAKDGTVAWSKRRLGKGSLMLAENQLYVLSDRGKLLLIEAKPDKYEEKGSVQALKGRCWTMPTLAHGRLFLRSQDEIVCYKVKI